MRTQMLASLSLCSSSADSRACLQLNQLPLRSSSDGINLNEQEHFRACVCVCTRKRQKEGERATECADHVRSSERRERGAIISPSDVKECLPAVGLGLRVVLTCNDRWMEGEKRESEVDLGPHLQQLCSREDAKRGKEYCLGFFYEMSQRVCCASFSVSLEHGLLQHNCTKHVGKQAGSTPLFCF